MNLRGLAARGVFWTALDNWGYQLATIIVFTILARLLEPEAFGLIALATVFTSLLKIVTDQGLADAIVQRNKLEPEHLDAAFWASAGFGALLAGLLAGSSWFLASAFDEPALGPVLAALALTLAINGLSSVQRAILTRNFAFATLTLRSLVSVVAGGIAGVVAAVLGAGVWSLVLQTLTFEVVAVVTLWAASDWRPHLRFSRRHLMDLLPFGANIVGFRALRLANTQSDNLIIGAYLGATQLGFYIVAYRLFRLLINMSTAVIGSVAFPTFSRVQDEGERVQSIYYRAMRLSALVTFPAFLGLIVIAPEVTLLMFGAGWEESVEVMQILGFAGLVTAVTFLNPTVLKSLGKPSWRVVIMGITAVAQVVAFLIAVQWGIRAVAIALTIVLLLATPAWFHAVHRLVRFRYTTLLRQFVSPAVAAGVMVVAVLATRQLAQELALLAEVLTLVGTGAVVYIGALWVVDRGLAREALEFMKLALPGRRKPGGSTAGSEAA